jgi:hypothetical protein
MKSPRLVRYGHALLAAIAIAFLIVLSTGSGPTTISGRLGGDYPAFYAAGQIITAGDQADLYSGATQRRYQEPLLGDNDGLLPFAYPPFFALAHAPFSQLPFRVAYALHTLLMIAALVAAARLVQRIYPGTFVSVYPLFFFALTYYPMFRAVIGGQNTALSLLLIILCWHRAVNARHAEAGLYLGLLMYKPQFALPLIGLFLLSGRWRVSTAAAAVAVVLYVVGALVSGFDWPVVWIEAARRFASIDAAANAANAVSWLGFAEALFGAGEPVALTLGHGLAVLTVIFVSGIWFCGGRNADLGAQLALGSVCLVLISPHAMFYELGITLISLAVLYGPMSRTGSSTILALWALGSLQLLSPLADISPAFAALMLTAALAAFHLLAVASGRLEDARR